MLWLDGCGSVGFNDAFPSPLAVSLATVELFLLSVSGDDATAAVHTVCLRLLLVAPWHGYESQTMLEYLRECRIKT